MLIVFCAYIVYRLPDVIMAVLLFVFAFIGIFSVGVVKGLCNWFKAPYRLTIKKRMLGYYHDKLDMGRDGKLDVLSNNLIQGGIASILYSKTNKTFYTYYRTHPTGDRTQGDILKTFDEAHEHAHRIDFGTYCK